MELIKKIKIFFIKIWSIIINFFIKKKKNNIKKQNKKHPPLQKKKIYKASIHRNEEIENNTIIFYPGILPKELELLNNKIDIIKQKVININDENIENELENIKNITKIINDEKIYVNQIDELNNLMENTLYDNLHISTNDKINYLKTSIENLIDEDLKDYEKNILKKAYYQYDKVNYVIITTILIDELYDELKNTTEDLCKNKHNKSYYLAKIKHIEEKLNRIEKINNRIEVQKELDSLKKDLYTKQKDKYDLLYNNEIFFDLNKKCEQILRQVEFNEQQEKDKKIIKQKEEKQKEKLKQEQREKEQEKKLEELKEEKQKEDNIIKRFLDLELARKILLIRELNMLKKEKKDIIKDTLDSYYEFIIGEQHQFNFLRNKVKTEVAKLYNDTMRNICILEDSTYIPIEHINLKLSDLASETLNNQQRLNKMIKEKNKVVIENQEISIKVEQKLSNILENEKKHEKERGNEQDKVKVYKKEYKINKAKQKKEINNKEENN